MEYANKVALGFLVGCLVLAAVSAVILTYLVPFGNPEQKPNQEPTPEVSPQPTAGGLEKYVGNLTGGISLFKNGEALVELNFEDGRVFTATEQLAAQANMAAGKTYEITFNSTAPQIAISIQEIQA